MSTRNAECRYRADAEQIERREDDHRGHPRRRAGRTGAEPAARIPPPNDGHPRHEGEEPTDQRHRPEERPDDGADQRGQHRVRGALRVRDEQGAGVDGDAADQDADDERLRIVVSHFRPSLTAEDSDGR